MQLVFEQQVERQPPEGSRPAEPGHEDPGRDDGDQRSAATARRRRPAVRARRQERSSARRACACSPLRRQAKSSGDEDRHLERQRHPRAAGRGRRLRGARAAGRPVPAGDQGRRRSHPQDGRRHPGLLDLLARHEGVLGRGAAHPQGGRARPAALRPSRVRSRDAHRRGQRRRRAGGVDLRPERRQGLRGQAPLSRGDGRLRRWSAHAAGRR